MSRKPKREKLHKVARTATALLAAVTAVSPLSGTPAFSGIPGNVAEADAAAARDPITYEYYTTILGNVVPSSWLFVGTYLMSAKAVTSTIYQGALDSRDFYNQNIAFYTSELDGGYWKNIENAESLSTILPGAEKVEESELYPYYITVVIGDDGIPRDPVTGEPIDVFNIVSVYDMENIPELDGIEDYLNSGKVSWKDEGAKNYFYRLLYFFFENDTLEGYRNDVSVSNAVNQYRTLMQDPAILEEVWDTALSKAPVTFPDEYRDIMMIMRNWPNIRDDVTDRADAEGEALNELYQELAGEDLDEEADSVMYVQRQVDATRRAEIYYNLIQNDSLFTSNELFGDEIAEEIELKRAETEAEMLEVTYEYDLRSAEIESLSKEIEALNTEIAGLEKKIEDGRSKARELSKEIDKLSGDLKKEQDDNADIIEKYETLDAGIRSMFESIPAEEDESVNLEKFEEATEEKKTLIETVLSKKEELIRTISDYTAQNKAALTRTDELNRCREELITVRDSKSRLEKVIEKEEKDYSDLCDIRDSYTESRFTAVVDRSKEYDPEQSKEYAAKADVAGKALEVLQAGYFSVCDREKTLNDTVNEIENGLELEKEIGSLNADLEKEERVLTLLNRSGIDNLDLSALETLERLAADSEVYGEKLASLTDMKAQLDACAPDYLKVKGRITKLENQIEEKNAQIDSIDESEPKIREAVAKDKKSVEEKTVQLREKESIRDSYDQLLSRLDTELFNIELNLSQAKKSYDPFAMGISSLNDRVRTLSMSRETYAASLEGREEEYKQLQMERSGLQREMGSLEESLNGGTQAEFLDKQNIITEAYLKAKADTEKLITEAQGRKEDYISFFEATEEYRKIEHKRDQLVNSLELAERLVSEEKRLEFIKSDLEDALRRQREHERENRYYFGLGNRSSGLFVNTRNNSLTLIRRIVVETEEARAEKQRLVDSLIRDLKALDTGFAEGTDRKAFIDRITGEIEKIEAEIEELKKNDGKIADFDEELADYDAELLRLKDKYEADIKKADEDLAGRLEEISGELEKTEVEYNAKCEQIEKVRKLKEAEEKRVADIDEKLKRAGALIDELSQRDTQISADSFGPSPTLYFLRDAVASGNPEMGRKYKNIAAYEGKAFETDKELLDIIEKTISLCEDSYESYLAGSLVRGEDAADYTGYVLSRAVARYAAKGTDRDTVMNYLQMITDLRSIEKDETNHATRELSLLKTWLIPFSMRDFVKEKTVTAQEDYQKYIKDITNRDSLATSIEFVTGRLEYAYSVKRTFEADGKTAVIQSHIDWLESLLNDLKEQAGLLDDSDYPEMGYEEYVDKMEQALADDDISTYKRLKAYIDAVYGEDGSDADDGLGRTDGSDDLKPTDLPVDNRPLPETEILDIILSDIGNEGYDITSDLDRYSAAGGSLGDLKAAMEDSGQGADYLNEILAAGLGDGGDGDADTGDGSDNEGDSGNGDTDGSQGGRDNDGSGSAGGDNSGNGNSGNGDNVFGKLEVGDIDDHIRDIMNTDDDQKKAAVVVLLSEKAQQTNNDELFDYALNLLNKLLRDGNTCIYRQYMGDDSREYVSLGAMDRCRNVSGFRYVRIDDTVTMSQMYGGSASYSFTVGNDYVEKNDSKTSPLTAATVEQTDKYLRGQSDTKFAYISEDDALKYLYCSAAYIRTTDWAILVTPGMAKEIEELAEIISEMVESGRSIF